MTEDRCHGKKNAGGSRKNDGFGGGALRRGVGATHKNIPQFFGYFRPSPENPAICEQCIVVDDELLIRQISPSTAKHFIKILLEYL